MSTQVTSHLPESATTPESAYQALIDQRLITLDAEQHAVLDRLEHLHQTLVQGQENKAEQSLFSRMFSSKKPQPATKGIYIYGDVGRGKSMLMDLFYATLPEKKIKKQRVHFHRFMQELHQKFHQFRKQKHHQDPIAQLVEQLTKNMDVLCFDELQATDVTDATLITRLFEGLIEKGIIVIATSNREPKHLYTGQVQKERFERLTQLIHQHFEVIHLKSAHDYRLQQIRGLKKVFHFPLDQHADSFINDTLHHLAPAATPSELVLDVQGRALKLHIYGERIGLASFAELCEQPLGPADYLAIAEALDVLVLKGIPTLSTEKRNEAKRFVTLIDALYEHKVKLIATAAALPSELYTQGHGSFEFERTVSRLIEMQSKPYMEAAKTK